MKQKLRQLFSYLAMLALLGAHMPSVSIAEEMQRTTFDPDLDPIACYRAINQLGGFYRGELVGDCFAVPALLCRRHTDPATCISFETRQVTEFLQEIAALPQQLPTIGDLPSSYRRALANVNAAQEPEVSCNDQSQDVCEFMSLMLPTMWAFRAGRIAGLQRGFYPDDRLFFNEPEGWDANNPAACMVVNTTLGLAYQYTVIGTCTERGLRACSNSDDDVACRQVHVATMKGVTSQAERIARSHLQAMTSSDPVLAADLELLSELPLNGGVNCTAPLTGEVCTYLNEQTRLKVALDIVFRLEPSLLLEILE